MLTGKRRVQAGPVAFVFQLGKTQGGALLLDLAGAQPAVERILGALRQPACSGQRAQLHQVIDHHGPELGLDTSFLVPLGDIGIQLCPGPLECFSLEGGYLAQYLLPAVLAHRFQVFYLALEILDRRGDSGNTLLPALGNFTLQFVQVGGHLFGVRQAVASHHNITVFCDLRGYLALDLVIVGINDRGCCLND